MSGTNGAAGATRDGQPAGREEPAVVVQGAVEPGSTDPNAPAPGEGGGVEEPANASPPPTKHPAWFNERINGLTGKLAEEKRLHDAAKTELTLLKASNSAMARELATLRSGGAAQGSAAGPAGGGGHASPPANASQFFTAEQVEQRAAELAAQRLAEQAAETQAQEQRRIEAESAQRGLAAYPDFNETLGNFKQLGGLTPEMLQMALDTGHAEHILYKLGKDLDLAHSVMNMPLGKMALEMAKLTGAPAAKGPAPVDASRAPAPMTTVAGARPVTTRPLDDPKVPTETWMEQRAREVQERKASGVRH